MEYLKIFVACFALLFGTAPGFSQSIQFQRASPDDPISQETVRAIAQDSMGFIWLATSIGLVRFDGYEYIFYRHNPADSNSLADDFAIALNVDRNKTDLWVGTNVGLSKLDLLTGDFENYRNDSNDDSSLATNKILSLAQDDQGYVWVGTLGSGLNRLDPATGVFTHYKHDPQKKKTIGGNIIGNIFIGPDGWMWYTTNQPNLRLERIHPQTGAIEGFQDRIGSILGGFHPVYQDRSGNIWAATQRGIFHYDFQQAEFIKQAFDPDNFSDSFGVDWNQLQINVVKPDRDGRLWLGTLVNGDFLVNLRTGDVQRTLQRYEPDGVAVNLWSVMEDRDGTSWFGGWMGYYKMYPTPDKFELMQWKTPVMEGVYLVNVSAVAVDEEGVLYINPGAGSGPALIRYDPKNKATRYYEGDAQSPNGLPDNWINNMIYLHDKLWIKLFFGEQRMFDPRTEMFHRIPQITEDTIDLSSPSLMFPAKNDRLWFRPNLPPDKPKSLLLYDILSRKIIQSISLPFHFHINTIAEDRQGFIWIGTEEGGLYRCDPDGKNFDNFLNEPANPNSLTGNRISAIHEDRQGNLWVSGYDTGLNRLINTSGPAEAIQFERFTSFNSGLNANNIFAILEDEKGSLWLSTKMGLSCLDPETGQIQNFGFSEKLQSHGESWAKSPDGTFYITGKSGVTVFNPDRFEYNQHKPAVVLTDFKLFDQPVPLRGREPEDLGYESPLDMPISHTKKIELAHWQNELSFDFVALNYIYPEKNQYKYRMVGYDQDWKSTSPQNRQATYTNLNPGKYTFQVIASNNDGLWNEEGTSVDITIHPPWWETWWARILYVVTAVMAVLGYVRWRTASLKKRQRELEQTVKERTAEVVAQKEVILKEKERSEELLLNILPEETAEELKLNGSARAKNYSTVTVLFTDFKGFTQHSERLSPEALVAEIDHCFKAFDLIMERYNVEKIKTVGDAYMAAAGLPTANTSNPVDAVNAALAIRDFMLEYKAEREAAGREAFEMRIGVHTGPVVAGIVGVKKFAYDIWGDTVNMAARMESSGEVGKVNISQSTFALLRGQPGLSFEARGKIKAKNKGELEMYFVERLLQHDTARLD